MAERPHASPAVADGSFDGPGLIDLALKEGIGRLEVAAVAGHIGVSVGEFEQRFGAVENLYLQVFDEVWAGFESEVFGAYEAEPCWLESLRAAAYAAARWLRDHPREARFAVIEMLSAGPMSEAVRERRLEGMVDLIDRGRECLDDPDSVGREVAVAVVGAVQGLLLQELQRGRGTASAEAFVPQLMYMAVRPYLGKWAALEELSLPPPPEL